MCMKYPKGGTTRIRINVTAPAPVECRACACIIPPVPVVYSGTVPGVLYYTVLYSTYPPVLRSAYAAQHYIVR